MPASLANHFYMLPLQIHQEIRKRIYHAPFRRHVWAGRTPQCRLPAWQWIQALHVPSKAEMKQRIFSKHALAISVWVSLAG